MSVPVHSLNNEQKTWYARLVIAAILADDEISPSEVDFMKQVIAIVKNPGERKELMQMIGTKKRPPISAPNGVENEVLAAIFIELILIMISDLEFADQEKVFLREVSEVFNFADSYFIQLMKWGEEGLIWKDSQRYLISEDGKKEIFQVPLAEMDSDQKSWYATILIATIMLDGVVDQSEMQFLKAAISIVDDKKKQQQLIGYVKNKMIPPISAPDDIPEEILTLIFFEVILIVSADENLSITEKTHLENIANLCGFSKEFLKSATDWCHSGISWKQNKNPLITNCKFSSKQRSAPGSLLGQNPDNNSILDREFGCYICDSKEKVKVFQLKPHSQEPNRNIFGIIAYFESLGDHDFIDYNLIKIFICPSCYFASAEKDLFKKLGKEQSSKTFANKQFKEFWLKEIEQRKSLFKDSKDEISSIKRSLSTVVKSYKLAIKAAKSLSKLNKDQSFDWQVVTLQLTLSEILMSNGNEKKAEEYLEQARVLADDLFKNAANTLIAIRSARLLFFIALYQNDVRVAGPFVDYIRQLYHNNLDVLKPNEQVVLKKVFGETQKALKDRSDYKKENLFGFHMEV